MAKMRMRATLGEDGVTEVKVLMAHPMENGLRTGPDGGLVKDPGIVVDYIRDVTVSCAGREVLRADWASAVSQNPFMAFRFRGGKAGDLVEVTATDTSGQVQSGEIEIK